MKIYKSFEEFFFKEIAKPIFTVCGALVVIALLLLFLTTSSCQQREFNPPYIITNITEGDGCCDLIIKDINGKSGYMCLPYVNLKKYKINDTLPESMLK